MEAGGGQGLMQGRWGGTQPPPQPQASRCCTPRIAAQAPTAGLRRQARAMAMRWRCPPLRLPPFSPITVSYLQTQHAYVSGNQQAPSSPNGHMQMASTAEPVSEQRWPKTTHIHSGWPYPLGMREMKLCASAAMAAATTWSMLAPVSRAMLSKMEDEKRVGVWLTSPNCSEEGRKVEGVRGCNRQLGSSQAGLQEVRWQPPSRNGRWASLQAPQQPPPAPAASPGAGSARPAHPAARRRQRGHTGAAPAG